MSPTQATATDPIKQFRDPDWFDKFLKSLEPGKEVESLGKKLREYTEKLTCGDLETDDDKNEASNTTDEHASKSIAGSDAGNQGTTILGRHKDLMKKVGEVLETQLDQEYARMKKLLHDRVTAPPSLSAWSEEEKAGIVPYTDFDRVLYHENILEDCERALTASLISSGIQTMRAIGTYAKLNSVPSLRQPDARGWWKQHADRLAITTAYEDLTEEGYHGPMQNMQEVVTVFDMFGKQVHRLLYSAGTDGMFWSHGGWVATDVDEAQTEKGSQGGRRERPSEGCRDETEYQEGRGANALSLETGIDALRTMTDALKLLNELRAATAKYSHDLSDS